MRDAIDLFFFAYWLKVLLFEETTDNLLIVIFPRTGVSKNDFHLLSFSSFTVQFTFSAF